MHFLFILPCLYRSLQQYLIEPFLDKLTSNVIFCKKNIVIVGYINTDVLKKDKTHNAFANILSVYNIE